MNPGDKAMPYCLSSGFDCLLYFWDLEKKTALKSSNIGDICKKNISGQLISPPLVYNLCVRQSTVLVSVQTGHIIALTFKDHKKVKSSIGLSNSKKHFNSLSILLMLIWEKL